MAEESEKRVWDRQEGEPARWFRRFLTYRNMGPERSVRKACEVTKLPKKGQKPAYAYWQSVSHDWGWYKRARAWDEYQDYLQRHADLEAEQAERERIAKERVRQRDLLTEEATSLRQIARTLASRIIEVLNDPSALARLQLHRTKAVQINKSKGGETRTEVQHPGVLELLNLVTQGMEVGGKLYRLASLDQPEDGNEQQPEQRARELGTVIAEQLIGADLATLLTLRQELAGLNGKVKPDRNPDT